MIAPFSRRIARSQQESAHSASWVITRMVRPIPASLRMIWLTLRILAPSSPLVGSSRIIIGASCIKATSGLDYRHMLEVSDNLNRLKEMGKSLFLITHDPELIYKCCTYLLFIQGSKVLWHRPMDGKAVELLRTFFSHEQETGAVNAS